MLSEKCSPNACTGNNFNTTARNTPCQPSRIRRRAISDNTP